MLIIFKSGNQYEIKDSLGCDFFKVVTKKFSSLHKYFTKRISFNKIYIKDRKQLKKS